MTDPERLLREGTELEKGLLAAGRDEEPSEVALGRTLLAVGIGATAAATGAALGSAISGSGTLQAGGTASLAGLALKWLGIGAVGGVLTMGVVTGVERALSSGPATRAVAPSSATVSVAQQSPRFSAAPPAPEPEKVLPDVPAPKPKAAITPSASSRPAPSGEPSIAEELRALDDARSALGSGNHSRVIAILDEYEKRPGPHRLSQEALYLRMEALSRAGYTAAAQIAARGLLASSPNGPHAARAREILGSAAPDNK